jgi:hypothetical protein
MSDFGWQLKRVSIRNIDWEADVIEAFLDLEDPEASKNGSEECDLVCAIMYAIHFGMPICIDDNLVLLYLNTPFARDAFSALEELERHGD